MNERDRFPDNFSNLFDYLALTPDGRLLSDMPLPDRRTTPDYLLSHLPPYATHVRPIESAPPSSLDVIDLMVDIMRKKSDVITSIDYSRQLKSVNGVGDVVTIAVFETPEPSDDGYSLGYIEIIRIKDNRTWQRYYDLLDDGTVVETCYTDHPEFVSTPRTLSANDVRQLYDAVEEFES